jgi:hypothetical protein
MSRNIQIAIWLLLSLGARLTYVDLRADRNALQR